MTQRSITSGANLPITTSDKILNVNVASPLTITLPLASSMGGISLAFKILIGSQSATFVPTGSDTFDTLTTLVGAAGQSVTFIPFNDGVNSGYAIW